MPLPLYLQEKKIIVLIFPVFWNQQEELIYKIYITSAELGIYPVLRFSFKTLDVNPR